MSDSASQSPRHAEAVTERQPPHGGASQVHDRSALRNRLPWLAIALALVLVGAGAIVISTAYDAPREAGALGDNLAVNDGATNALDLNANNSPTLVRNPVDEGNLAVINRIDSPEYSCALHVSFDGGGRWIRTPIPAPVSESEPKCYAPDAAFAADGTLYVTYVTLRGRANTPDAVWITSSRDGGKTMSAPVETPLGERAFGVRLTADPRVPERVFLTWLAASEVGLYKFIETGNPIMSIRSDDGGVNWTEPTRVSSAARQRVVAPTPAAGRPDGELNVLYLDLRDDALDYNGGHGGQGGPPYNGRWQLVLSRSSDNGATWRESVVDDAIVPTERFIVFTPPTPTLAVDPRTGRLYAAFHDGRLGDSDVLLWSLPGDGGDWSEPTRVNDTPRGDGTAQQLPQLSVAPDGRLDILYFDRRADRTNVLNEASLQASFDEGRSFTSRVKLSDRAFSSRVGFGLERDMADLGSRLGLVSSNDRAYAVWTDTRAGSVRTAKQDLARGVVAFTDPPRLSGAAEALLRYGGIAILLIGLVVAVKGVTGRPRRRSAA
jgi:hypothetical protein